MANKHSCIVHPQTKSGEPSKLFSDLRKEFSYKQSWEIWDMAVSPEYNKQFGTQTVYDEYGEPTIESILSNFNIVPDNPINTKKYEDDLNHNLPEDNLSILQRVVDFNSKHNAVKASLSSFNLAFKEGNSAHIIVEQITPEVLDKAKALEVNTAIYKSINQYLNNLGYSIDFFDGEFFNGEQALMTPNSGITTANGLKNVIRISNNQEALAKLPEELGHFLIECSKDNKIVERALNTLRQQPELIDEILGDDLTDVNNYYLNQGRPDLIPKEALGRLLIKSINKDIDLMTKSQEKPLYGRIKGYLDILWNKIKNFFKENTDSKKEAVLNLEDSLKPILHTFSVTDNKKQQIKKRFEKYGDQMAHVTTLMQDYNDLFASDGVAQKIRETIAREDAYYSKTYRDIKGLEEAVKVTRQASELFIQRINKSIVDEPKEYDTSEEAKKLEILGFHSEKEILDIRNIHHFCKYITYLQNLIEKQLSFLGDAQEKSTSYEDVLNHAERINTIRSFVETQEPIINDILNFSKAIDNSGDPEIDSFFRDASKKLNEVAIIASQSINDLKSELYSAMDIVTQEFWENSVDEEVIENIIPEHLQKKHNLTNNAKKIEHILSFSLGDISGVSRIFTAYYAQKDPLINLVNNTLRKQEEAARIASQIFTKEIAEIVHEYVEATGSSDLSFIYELDENGKPTHFLKTKEGVSLSKWRAARQAYFKKIKEDDTLTPQEKYEKRQNFLKNTLDTKDITNYIYDQSTNSFTATPLPVGIKIPTKRLNEYTYDADWIDDSYSKLNEAQKTFLDKYLEAKNKLESILPNSVRCKNEGLYYRAVQRVVSSASEAILNNKTGFFSQLGGLISHSTFKLNEDETTDTGYMDDDDYEDENPVISEDNILKGITSKVKGFKERLVEAVHQWVYPDDDPVTNTPDTKNPKKNSKIITKRTSSEFNQRRKVPIYFTQMLDPERLSQLSTDAAGSLIEYTMACFRYKAMNEVADIMELTYERAKFRRLQKTKFGRNYLLSMLDKKNQEDTFNQTITNDSAGSDMLKSLRQLLDTKLYSEYNMDARGAAGSISPDKITQTLLRATAFSMLGYNIFSGINNIVVGKYQTMIEAIAGTEFTKKDWAWAELEYKKLLPEYIKELGNAHKTSKLALLDELFNATMEWKDNIEGAKYFMNPALRVMSQFNSGMLMNMGEKNMKLVALLAKLHNYKMKDTGGNETNLYESLDYIYKTDKKGNRISGQIKIKRGYTKPDGKAFTISRKDGYEKSDLFDFCLKMNVMNHRMHGIYNREDQIEALRHWWGKLLLLFRRFIVPTVEKRYAGSRYNVDTKQWEEGFYITGLKWLMRVIMNESGAAFGHGRFKAAAENFNSFQKANINKFKSEFITMLALMFLLMLLPDYKDDDQLVTRSINYHTRRLIQEIEFYQPWNINSIYDILQSPSATLGLMTRYFKVIGSIPNMTDRYKAGPNKGKLKIVQNAKRALPIYPQVRDVINFAHDDSRFQIFDPILFERMKDE